MTRVQNEWTLYAKNDIADCAGLDGKKLAIHSQGAVSTSMVKNYVATVCSGTEPEYIVIEGSPNRVAALRANQIDASPLELADAIGIDAQDPTGSTRSPALRTTCRSSRPPRSTSMARGPATTRDRRSR